MPTQTLPSTVQRACSLLQPRTPSTGGLWELSRLMGRVVEVSEAGFFGALSALCPLLAQVQARQEQIAWVETGTSIFFPPDLAFRGLDVQAITVVMAPDSRAGLQAADSLLRSGAFGLIILDWPQGQADEAVLGRLARVAEAQQTAVLFLTKKKPDDPSLGTQISLRGSVFLSPEGETLWQVTRDKQAGPRSRQGAFYHGPFGLY